MIFTSLTTIIISIAAMAGVAIADDLKVTPMNLPCDKPVLGPFATESSGTFWKAVAIDSNTSRRSDEDNVDELMGFGGTRISISGPNTHHAASNMLQNLSRWLVICSMFPVTLIQKGSPAPATSSQPENAAFGLKFGE
ncbi:hypothetical protein EV702DRAFT_1053208 [Suillus placidus]|uniref:Uncharacterized protein n=1 Tax=Suillus placidus TaxID=48579 RepID=A0A9P7CVF1_9AGAM|nr:hypothetical protein EV702DRAFT_1053208 [Suillus placidus]